MVHGRPDDVPIQAAAPGHLVEGPGTGLELGEHRPERAGPSEGLTGCHGISRPTWNTPTAITQASTNCIPIPIAVQRIPISRRCAASVATHGV
jgi:hypothetical protein